MRNFQVSWEHSDYSRHSELSHVWMPPGSTSLWLHSRTEMKLLFKQQKKLNTSFKGVACRMAQELLWVCLAKNLGIVTSTIWQTSKASGWPENTEVFDQVWLLWPAQGWNASVEAPQRLLFLVQVQSWILVFKLFLKTFLKLDFKTLSAWFSVLYNTA